jgi:hypothetical protein
MLQMKLAISEWFSADIVSDHSNLFSAVLLDFVCRINVVGYRIATSEARLLP